MRTVEFEVYPDLNDSLFWVVHVCPNRRSMLRRFHRLRGPMPYNGEKFAACVMPITRQAIGADGKTTTFPILGNVLFDLTHFSVEALAHESVHMATGYLRRKRRTVKLGQHADEREEQLAYPAGRCAEQIGRELKKRGLL